MPDAFDQLLDVVEETFSFQSKSQWLSTTTFRNSDIPNTLDTFSTNSLKLLNIVYVRFDEYVSQHSQISIQDENIDIHTSMINDLRSRFEVLSKLLKKETT